MKDRYQATNRGVFDKKRNTHILQRISPSANYNDQVIQLTVTCLNAFNDAIEEYQEGGERLAHNILIDTFKVLNR